MTGRRHAKSSEVSPGPGQYTPNDQSVLEHAPVVRVGTAQRTRSESVTRPGPGSYNSASFIGESAQWKFARTSRKTVQANSNPGPGAYNTQPKDSARGYTLVGRKPHKSLKIVPGPGAYSPSKQETTPRFSMGRSSRNRSTASIGPGPGTYSPSEVKPSTSNSCDFYAAFAAVDVCHCVKRTQTLALGRTPYR